jgi:hypothetical protein
MPRTTASRALQQVEMTSARDEQRTHTEIDTSNRPRGMFGALQNFFVGSAGAAPELTDFYQQEFEVCRREIATARRV